MTWRNDIEIGRLLRIAAILFLCMLAWRAGYHEGRMQAALALTEARLSTAEATIKTLTIAVERTAGIVVDECDHKLNDAGEKSVTCTVSMGEAGVP